MNLIHYTRRDLFFNGVLLCLIILEINCILFFPTRDFVSRPLNAIVLFASSLLFGVFLILKFYKREVSLKPVRLPGSRRRYFLTFGVFLTGFAGICILLNRVFLAMPVDQKISDIIPTIQLMAQRLLQGSFPYKPILDWGYYFQPTYLPMQWIPYVIAEMLHFDYRWIAAGIWLLACCMLLWRTVLTTGYIRSCLIAVLLLYAIWNIARFDDSVLGTTVELMVAGYYILFIIGLNQNNPWLKGLFIAFCLLSRYSLVLWLPLWLFVEFISGNRKQLFPVLGTILLVVVALYIAPFLSRDWGSFFKGYNYYTGAAYGEWTNHNNPGQPYHLYQGVGFARYFYEGLGTYNILDRIKSLQRVHFILSLGSVVLMGIWYWFCRRHIHYRVFLLGSFKIYLAFFLNFIQVPYIYLMITAIFVSISIFSEQLKYKVRPIVSRSLI